ncbi:MAG: formylglycine-generating enzyme family protein [Candidatus Brocadiae bacterium]|nr:formylglycine-generating enzyme family protein [Candidatus Brocadiia bacterium]
MRFFLTVFLSLLLAFPANKARCEETIEGFTYLRQETYSCNGQEHTVKEYLHNQTGLEFILIPGGSFMMGGNIHEDEKPVHKVILSSFLMAKYELTQEVWEKFMGNNPSFFKDSKKLPVECISWYDCKEFCDKTLLDFPTEAQWEYACRAGSTTEYFWGNSLDGTYLWYNHNSGFRTHPVGQKKPNAFGLYDISGNVWEWCKDTKTNYTSDEQTDPLNTSGISRILRSGGWSRSDGCRSAIRDGNSPVDKYNNIGFRPALHYTKKNK